MAVSGARRNCSGTPVVIAADPRHSESEIRIHALAKSHGGRLFHIAFTSSTKTISLRLPQHLLNSIKAAANARDVPYPSLIKVWLQEKLRSH